LRRGSGLDKARTIVSKEPPMSGIAAIVIFLVVIGALNVFEFGRLD
jgi:hypothetical protein